MERAWGKKRGESGVRETVPADQAATEIIRLDGVWKVFGARAEEAMAAIRRENLSKPDVLARFDCVVGIVDVSFSIARGEIFCIMGLSGSGKSTLVRHINRLIEPTAGNITLLGHDLMAMSDRQVRELRANRIGMVFQHMALMPHRSVRDNVTFPLEVQKKSRSERWEISQRTLAMVNLEGFEDHMPDQLSGGMKQRVGIARALASGPDILLMDEPFSALDPLIRRQLQDQFLALSRKLDQTTVFITHDLDEAIRLGDRIAIMKDGRIVQIGTPEDIVSNPADDYIAEFVKDISTLGIIHAAAIMQPIEDTDLPDAAARAAMPRVAPDCSLDRLVSIAVDTDGPILVCSPDDAVLGVVTKTALLMAVGGEGRPADTQDTKDGEASA